MPRIETSEFDARLNGLECGETIRKIVGYLRKAAEQAGPIEWRAHSTKGGGWGIAGKRINKVVCRFDPKPTVPHVCVQIPGAADYELKVAGTVHKRKNAMPWVDVRDMAGAEVLAPLVARAWAEAAPAPARAKSVHRSEPADRPAAPAKVRTQANALREELRGIGFAYAGVIRPLKSGKACRFELGPLELRGSVVYALVVGDQLKKCGDTGRKNATLKARMNGCANTINQVLSGALAGRFTENFKRLAPKTIEANQEIEVWARQATPDQCRRLQRELNGNYDTIRTG